MPRPLYIIRHGKANAGSTSGRDEDRALAPQGEEQALWLGRQIAQAHASTTGEIIASPFLRARQTAEVINRSLNWPLRFDDRLQSGLPVSCVVDLIDDLAREHSSAPAVIVGHNPQLERLIHNLLRGSETQLSELRTGECWRFELTGAETAPASTRFISRSRFESAD